MKIACTVFKVSELINGMKHWSYRKTADDRDVKLKVDYKKKEINDEKEKAKIRVTDIMTFAQIAGWPVDFKI